MVVIARGFFERPAYKVEFDGTGFLKNGERCKGLVPTIQKHYYPNYSRDKAVLHMKQPRPLPSLSFKGVRKSNTRQIRRACKGTFLGIVVHDQIELSVGYCITHNLPVDFFVTGSTRRLLRCPEVEHVYHFCEELMQEDVWRFWGLLASQNWLPVASELPVAHPSCRVGTGVDVVVATAPTVTGDVFLNTLEIKTGALHYLYQATATRMTTPFEAQSDCVANQHHIQLVHTDAFLRATYPYEIIQDSFIVRLFQGGVHLMNQRNWAETQKAAVMRKLDRLYRLP